MQRLEPILKSWVIWLTLAASVAGFVALVVTDGDARPRHHTRHPAKTGHERQPNSILPGRVAYIPQRSAPSS